MCECMCVSMCVCMCVLPAPCKTVGVHLMAVMLGVCLGPVYVTHTQPS